MWCSAIPPTTHEGLPPHGPWRSDLVCLYGVELERRSGSLVGLELQPFQLRGFQLQEASTADRQLIEHQLGLEAAPAGWRCRNEGHGWRLEPQRSSSAALVTQPHTSPLSHP
jgi:hypothetical protein